MRVPIRGDSLDLLAELANIDDAAGEIDRELPGRNTGRSPYAPVAGSFA